MNQLILERAVGSLGPNAFARLESTRLLRSFRPATHLSFDGGERALDGDHDGRAHRWAHQAGVSALALERFDGRLLVSGGSDAAIRLWNLEQLDDPESSDICQPVARIARNTDGPPGISGPAAGTENGHRFGITHLSFYPFDQGAFLSSSYDHTLKLWSANSTRLAGSFDLGSRVYTHAISPIASHLAVACATQHPAVRLVDLRTSSAVQALLPPGSAGSAVGANLSVAWSPTHEHVLASGTADGALRVWDVRRASGLIALLDQEDSLGIYSRRPEPSETSGLDPGLRSLRERGIRASAKAHTGPVNALAWTDDSHYLVSAGHDRRIRVWDAATGANTLVSFGPTIRNGQLASLHMFTSPSGLTAPGDEVLFFPNETEILIMDLHNGSVVTRLRGTGPTQAAVRSARGAERTTKNRITSLVWRGAGGGGSSSGVDMGGAGAAGGLYSGHLDGQIRPWVPIAITRDDEDEPVITEEEVGESRARKRRVIDTAYRALMGKQITFT
ncbi:WD40 repeat-like protein [Thozetella sp. PMI_491]|nr:WD40 repeat-like protein [Thozetella sp. PMI_491]